MHENLWRLFIHLFQFSLNVFLLYGRDADVFNVILMVKEGGLHDVTQQEVL